MNRMGVTLLAVIGLLAIGCTSERFEIELKPQGDQFERTLKVSRQTSGPKGGLQAIPDTEVERLTREYFGNAPQVDGIVHRFRGVFQDRAPQDVGGFGTWKRWDSPLGSVTFYVERFRGQDDLAGEVEARTEAVRTAVRLLADWLKDDAGDDPDFPRLHEFLTTRFQRDLMNLSLYSFATGFDQTIPELGTAGIAERVSLYLLERRYITLEELPGLVRAFEQHDEPRVAQWLKRMLARQLDLADDQPFPALFQRYDDWQAAQQRLQKYLRKTPEFAQQLEQSRQQGSTEHLDPLNLISEPLTRALFPGRLFGGSDQVALQMQLPRMPFLTNGAWLESQNQVVWDLRVEVADPGQQRELPQICFAAWSEPNTEAQRTHFGRVVLDHADLATYGRWYHGLTTAEQAEWDAFLNRLRPSNRITLQLRGFRFRHEQAAVPREDAPPPLVTPIADLIAGKLAVTRAP